MERGEGRVRGSGDRWLVLFDFGGILLRLVDDAFYNMYLAYDCEGYIHMFILKIYIYNT